MTGKNPLFSVLIANHNNAQFLQECIQSVLSQSYSNLELIVVDDSSSDHSMDILEEMRLKDNRIHVFQNDQNSGCGYTKRKCVEKSNGFICGFLDSDDCLHKIAVEKMVEFHVKIPLASIVYSQNYECDDTLNVIRISNITGYIPKTESHLTSNYCQKISHFCTFKNYHTPELVV